MLRKEDERWRSSRRGHDERRLSEQRIDLSRHCRCTGNLADSQDLRCIDLDETLHTGTFIYSDLLCISLRE